jgi:hypothetical protein
MEAIKSRIRQFRPNLTESSLKTYGCLLKCIHEDTFPNEPIRLENFYKTREILEVLQNRKNKKTICASLFVLTQVPEYKNMMIEEIKKIEVFEIKQEKTDKQIETMISFDDVKTKLAELKIQADDIFKTNLFTNRNLQILVDYILLVLTSGIYLEPRRSLDWSCMRFRNYNNQENFYDGEYFIFNKYKTKKLYNQQKIEVPLNLREILDNYLEINPTEYVLFNQNQKILNPSNITMRLNSIFGNNISTSILRHIYITEKFKNQMPLAELRKTANNLGHSINQMFLYVKN